MKTILMTVYFLFTLALVNAQNDSIFYKDGRKVEVIIKSTDTNTISYLYPNEDILNTENKSLFNKIIYKSGRIEVYSTQLEEIKNVKDWEKVIITLSESDVIGLTKVAEVKGYCGLGPAMQALSDKNAREDIKKNAAKLKCSIILIAPYKINYFWGTTINGVAYK